MSSTEDPTAGASSIDTGDDVMGTIEAWRERGAHRFAPVRFRFIEALARRAATHEGPVRQVLHAKVAQLLASYGNAIEQARPAHADAGDRALPSPSADAPARLATRGMLGELVDHIARHASPHEDERAAGGLAPRAGSPVAELKTLRYFRSTWSKLSAHQRLTQSLAKVPVNAGPLNSNHLVHRSLTLMRDLSPEYLNRFISYVDALLWLEQAHRKN